MASQLSLNEEEAEPVISDLLIKHNFDIPKVEWCLFKMVGLVGRNLSYDLNAADKQENYLQAQKPVENLKMKCEELKECFFKMDDYESSEWKEKKNELEETEKCLQLAMKNAASDIYYSNNIAGNMGTLIDDDYIKIDLHGQKVDNAKEIFVDLIQPVLPVVKRCLVITGRGVHNSNNTSYLKEAMKDFFEKNNFSWKQADGNEGALYVNYKPL